MAELADAHDSGSCGATHAGSSPVIRTRKMRPVERLVFFFWHCDLWGKPPPAGGYSRSLRSLKCGRNLVPPDPLRKCGLFWGADT